MFFLLGTPISQHDAEYLVATLISLRSSVALDAAEMIARGLTGRRNPIPLSPAMQEAVYTALSDDPPEGLRELRARAGRRSLRVKEW
jgi:hypothetical protein